DAVAQPPAGAARVAPGTRASGQLPSGSEMTTKGGKCREKVVKLLVFTTPEEILEKLKREAKKK
uniref:Uncharacterized protein n=1 Tax=Prolemur simus TaxID=1328070 RepID=A0A8C9DJN3_PROSS